MPRQLGDIGLSPACLAGKGGTKPVPTLQQPLRMVVTSTYFSTKTINAQNPGADYLLFVEKSARTNRRQRDVASNNPSKSTSQKYSVIRM